MSISELGSLGELIGAIAVFISILYLAYQIRQNTRMMQGTTIQAITESIQRENHWSSELGEIWMKSKVDGERLSDVEAFRLGEWLTAAMHSRQNEFIQFRNGLLSDELWTASEGIIRGIMKVRFASKWWRRSNKHVFSGDFVRLVDEIVESIDASQSVKVTHWDVRIWPKVASCTAQRRVCFSRKHRQLDPTYQFLVFMP